MVVADVVQDDGCNSCSIHYNLSKVSNILPLVSVDDALEFMVQLCSELSDQEKHNVCKCTHLFHLLIFLLSKS